MLNKVRASTHPMPDTMITAVVSQSTLMIPPSDATAGAPTLDLPLADIPLLTSKSSSPGHPSRFSKLHINGWLELTVRFFCASSSRYMNTRSATSKRRTASPKGLPALLPYAFLYRLISWPAQRTATPPWIPQPSTATASARSAASRCSTVYPPTGAVSSR